jgi:hypothetical protein
MQGENRMPWSLQYLRHRKKGQPFPTIWWPVAAPWGALLCAMTMFLIITSKRQEIAGFHVTVAVEADTSAHPLAVLRMRANRTATLRYFRADKLPDVRAALIRKDLAALPPPALPKDLSQLGEDWVLIGNDFRRCDLRGAFFGEDPARDPACNRQHPPPTWQRMLVAREYHHAIDWDGVRQALLDAKAAGIESDLVFVEADDEAQLDAIILAMDLCMTLGLRPALRMQ